MVHKVPPFNKQTPYIVGIIELNEGVRMMSRILGEGSEMAINQPVTVIYEKIDDELTLPYFQLT